MPITLHLLLLQSHSTSSSSSSSSSSSGMTSAEKAYLTKTLMNLDLAFDLNMQYQPPNPLHISSPPPPPPPPISSSSSHPLQSSDCKFLLLLLLLRRRHHHHQTKDVAFPVQFRDLKGHSNFLWLFCKVAKKSLNAPTHVRNSIQAVKTLVLVFFLFPVQASCGL